MPVSRFIQRYNQHLVDAEQHGDTIVLEQRAGRPAWVLEPQAQVDATMAAVSYVSNALVAIAHDDELVEKFAQEFTRSLPWVRLLPSEDRVAFVAETADTLRACAGVGRFGAFERLVDDWRNTAELWADPSLAAALAEPVGQPIDVPVE